MCQILLVHISCTVCIIIVAIEADLLKAKRLKTRLG